MSEHCQVDFYLLGSPDLPAERLACKLAAMAWERGHSVSILTATPELASELDALLWEYPEGRFIPHDCGDNVSAPVTIVTGPPAEADVLINLTLNALEAPLPYTRLLEIVPHRKDDREASREKFRQYRAAGLSPQSHEIN